MTSKQDLLHIFVVTFHGQGHVNPLLRLSNLLALKGNLLVTFSASKSVGNKMKIAGATVSGDPTPVGNSGGAIRFEFFDDGCSEHNDDERKDIESYMTKIELPGKKSVAGIINRQTQDGRPVSCIINNPFMPWVTDLAQELNIPCAVLWVQSCACFSSYYHYENSLVRFPSEEQPDVDVKLPNMPVLKSDEIPSFLHPSTPYPFLRKAILGQFKNLSKSFCVLMETFQELEDDLIKYMSRIHPIRPVGPLFKNPLLETGSNVIGDMIKADDECLNWLGSKERSSVVYISFGSIVSLSQEQVTEMAHGVYNSGLSFLWVMRMDGASNDVVLPEGLLENGLVVGWSPQARVLAHRAVACFVSHCGWNSTMEALSNGVPIVAFPHWGDQVTNAKYMVDEWKIGIRLQRCERKEVEECLREASGGAKAAEMKENALKWKKAAEDAVGEGGTTDRSIEEFVESIKRISSS